MYRFALTIFISAFLLFQVQPIIARFILPWFGGASTVWTICLLFFQTGLLLGYLYAHLLRYFFNYRQQVQIHLVLVCSALFVLPILPDPSLQPIAQATPTKAIISLLLITIGLPYFLLSASGPLIQYWFKIIFPGTNPYRLYSLSNLGSLIALLSYPLLIEPVFTLTQQVWIWSGGYVLYFIMCSSCGWYIWHIKHVQHEKYQKISEKLTIPKLDYLLWIFLPALASILLIASTNYLIQDVAAVPFLWILPLSLYLLSFIICFDHSKWYNRYFWVPLFLGSLIFGIYTLLVGSSLTIGIHLIIINSLLFTACMVCHGELVRIKPSPRSLTTFYLLIAFGDAIGGFFVAIIAPEIFSGYWELQFSWCAIILVLGICIFRVDYGHSRIRRILLKTGWVFYCATLALILITQIENWQKSVVGAKRNFYGVLWVKDETESRFKQRYLYNGHILHGSQVVENENTRKWPTTYFSRDSGVGVAISEYPDSSLQIGVVGMGAATIASLMQANDYIRFYEINPDVIHFSQRYFTYLQDTVADWDVVIGDARISLEQELLANNKNNFDILAIDAFSGDAIPVHLLTIEAFKLYWNHLKEDGVLAVHVSNLHLSLDSVVEAAADALDKNIITIINKGDQSKSIYQAKWVLMTNNQQFLNKERVQKLTRKKEVKKPLIRPWEDNYSNLLGILN